MGFSLEIQADYGSVKLGNNHPEGKPSGGKAVFAFLGGLDLLTTWEDDDSLEHPSLRPVVAWYRALEKSAGVALFPTCQPLLDCMWGDGGDSTEYGDDDFELFRENSGGFEITEEGFHELVRAGRERWRPIPQVAKAVALLLEIFGRVKIEPMDGWYVPEDTIPDFEALAANLDFLITRGHEVVRLNFN